MNQVDSGHWQLPHSFPQLGENAVHVWRMQLTNQGDYAPFLPQLAAEEVTRANRFLFEKHRERFVVGRASLRGILAQYVDGEPHEIEFTYENLGKPQFKNPSWSAEFSFNFSNSHELGLLAITRKCRIGVDLERVRPMHDMLGLADRFYARQETDQLFALPDAEQPDAFFRCWTRKEAYLKAIGKGLTFPLRSVEVTLLANQACRIVHINDDPTAAADWSMFHLSPAEGYHGALAIRNPGSEVPLQWQWRSELT